MGKRLCHEKFEAIYVSDLLRTIDTAKIIYDQLPDDTGKPLFIEESRLREKSAGIYEGLPLGTTSGVAKD